MATAPLMPDLEAPCTLARFNRQALEYLIEAAIELLDRADGDSDDEEDNEDACPSRDDCGTCKTFDGYGDGYPGDEADAEIDDVHEDRLQPLEPWTAPMA
ncbi:MAG: hypothetical protein B7Y35_11230 [Sphingomonadales bacterium 28-64-96]|nr:MAG: hypothetical protein B7Y35_11230 [Sphingomonadales bacterium 28-64-96]